ncbi:hypothetical protein LOZ58_006523 [Ophidiomyces ophidiicola]|nr:hypothetical protein LOZ65_006775 [Ophidiomyces ophidiicola]KAI1933240.1 hypothetical protein LOZ66_006531 [Ophidiomyces ophidiicola]KAI1955915.1 hypothetical protein LOZ58_006523 [Ophidiomyces ophidiicola]
MWAPVTLPYRSESPSIPRIPSTDEIRSCSNIIWESADTKVVAVNDEIVVKFGVLPVHEGEALIHLERHAPQVPAPRLYAMFYDDKELFFIMQRMPGVQLDKIWSSLTESEKDDIISKLHRIFDDMRLIECPQFDFYGNLSGGGVSHYLFYSQHSSGPRHLGPFNGEAAFIAGLVGNFRALVEKNHRPDFQVRFYETYLGRVFQGHRPTLTHGDVQQKNIMVAENAARRNNQGERSFDVALVDWADAGWYPEFWEFFSASMLFRLVYWETDWCWRAQEFLQVYPAELALMRMFDKDFTGWYGP